MTQLWTNNAASTLASGITAIATSLTVATGQGALFPAITGGNDFYVTLVRASDGAIEIVEVTARSGDVFTVVRAREGTTGLVCLAGDKVELRITAAWLTTMTGTRSIATGGTNQTAFTAPSGNVSPLIYFDGTSLNNDAVITHAGYNTSTNTLTTLNTLASNNLSSNSQVLGAQSIATTGGTTTFTSASPYYTIFTGTQGQTLVLPDATTLAVGWRYGIDNDSTQSITVNASGGGAFWIIAPGCDLYITCTGIGTAAGTWEKDYAAAKAATGKALTISNTLTFTGTDGSSVNFGAGGTVAYGINSVVRSARTSNTILGAADKGTLIDITSGAFTQTLTAAATLGSGWWCYYRNSSTGPLTAMLSNTTLASWTGTDVIVNGTFASDTAWTKGTGWTISGGTAVASSASGALRPSTPPLTARTCYVVTYTTTRSGGNLTLNNAASTLINHGPARSSNATFTEYLTSVSTNVNFGFVSSNFSGTLDNVSAKPVSSSITTLTIGNKYRATFSIATVEAGNTGKIGFMVGTQNLAVYSAVGTYAVDFYADNAASTMTFYIIGNTFAGTLGSDISLIDITPGDIVLDPNGSELIDGVTSYTMYPNEARLIQCDGSAFSTVVVHPFYKEFAATGTFTTPPGYQTLEGLLFGGGGSGAKSSGTVTATGGGGGACVPFALNAQGLGASQTVTIGAVATGPSGASTVGVAGNSSLFSTVTAYGGGGGTYVATTSGGTGGGALGPGLVGDTYTSGVLGGEPANTGFGGGGAAASTGVPSASGYGGAAGGGGNQTLGASAVYGGAGGSAYDDTATTLVGASVSLFGGGGGGGNQWNGIAPSGGGGGTSTGTKAGNGARGEMRIWGIA